MGASATVPDTTLHAGLTFDADVVEPPIAAHLLYSERVLQFGTGAFLRSFAEYFLDQANRSGTFAGRAVVVGSTGSGRSHALAEQDSLYTLCTRGLDQGQEVDVCRVIASISRALSAADSWKEVLEVAASPALEFIISNTTEIGIQLDPADRPDLEPPQSFPGKLAAVLARRAEVFGHDPGKGLIVLPCELIEDNGDRLKEIVLELARRWDLPPETITWISEANIFCNTLVDCIVTGLPERQTYASLVERLGYEDRMLTVAEPYKLWVIERDDALLHRIDFLASQPEVVIAEDISEFRERKVRLLNGAHTLLVPVGLLCGVETVREAVTDSLTGAFVRRVMLQEIVPSLPIDEEASRSFALQVIERFANPYIEHELTSIALQQTSKLHVRVFPSLRRYSECFGELPPMITFGYAAMIALKRKWLAVGRDGSPHDDADERWRGLLATDRDAESIAASVLKDRTLWKGLPGDIPGLIAAVAEHLKRIEEKGPRHALQRIIHP